MSCWCCCEDEDQREQMERLVSNDFLGDVHVPTQIISHIPQNRLRDESVFTRLLDLSGRLSTTVTKVLVSIFEEHCVHGILGLNELMKYLIVLYPATHKRDGGEFVGKRSGHILKRWGIEYQAAISNLSDESRAPPEIVHAQSVALDVREEMDQHSTHMRPTADSLDLSYSETGGDHLAATDQDEKDENDGFELSQEILDGPPPTYDPTDKVLTLRRFLEYYHKSCHEHPMMVRIELVMLGHTDFRYNRLVDTRKSIDVLAYSVQQQRDLSAIYDDERNRLDDGGQLVSIRAKEVMKYIQDHESDDPFSPDYQQKSRHPNIYHKPLVWKSLRVCCPCCLSCISCCGCCVT